MSFFEEIKLHKGKRRIYDIIFFAFISSFIAALENMFPRPIPYFRIGFSFIIIIIVLDSFKLREMILLILIKNLSVAIAFAYIFTPPFYLGLCGGIVSVIIMKFMRVFKNTFSFFGIKKRKSNYRNKNNYISKSYKFYHTCLSAFGFYIEKRRLYIKQFSVSRNINFYGHI